MEWRMYCPKATPKVFTELSFQYIDRRRDQNFNGLDQETLNSPLCMQPQSDTNIPMIKCSLTPEVKE